MKRRKVLWKLLVLATSLGAGYIVQWGPISPRPKSTGATSLPRFVAAERRAAQGGSHGQ